MYDVIIYTDGSSSPADHSGGWAALLRKWPGGPEKVISGYEANTTNQRMELQAAIGGLAALKRRRRLKVKVISDSAYLVNCFHQGWMDNWKLNGWRTYRNKPVENRDLWEQLESQVAHHDVEFEHVKGHAGHTLNERVDRLASEARRLGVGQTTHTRDDHSE